MERVYFLNFWTEFRDSNTIVVRRITLGGDAGHYKALVPSSGRRTDKSEWKFV